MMAAEDVDVFGLTDIDEIQQAYSKIHLHEQQLNNDLDAILDDQTRLDAKMNSLQNVIPSLHLVMKDAQQLFTMISSTSDLAEKVSSKVRLIDLVKSRVQETIKRVDDILDLKACVDGVQSALNTENFEQAAAHIHRYLSLDENALREIIGDSTEGSDLSGSFCLLHEAELRLKKIVNENFDAAISQGDPKKVERFFKIFPLLGQHDVGLQKYAQYLCAQVALEAQKNLEIAVEMKESDRKASVVFANTLNKLMESIARIVDEYQPTVETYYGHGKLHIILEALQMECDNQSLQIAEEFLKKRQFTEKLRAIKKSQALKSSANLERYDPRGLDVLLGEVVVMNARTELYMKFLENRIQNDMENVAEEERPKDVSIILDKLITNSGLCRKMQELIGNYIYLEEYFMRETVLKAVSMDYYEGGEETDEAVTSSMVDDVFFIIQKSVKRALSSSSVDGVCAMLNHASAVLSSEYRDVLSAKLKAGFPSGSIDLSVMLQGKFQVGVSSTAENAAARKAFLVTLNNLEVSCVNMQKLKRDLEAEFDRNFHHDEHTKMKVESCLNDVIATSNIFKDLLQSGLYQLYSTAVKPRLKPLVDGFTSISHNITEEEFSYYEVNDPFIQNLITNMDAVLSLFKGPLTAANYNTLVSLVTTDITAQFEKAVLKSTFNRLGGLQFDKELRSLVGYLTAITQWTIRDKFARLTQISTLLNLEKVTEVMDYWGANSGPMTWRLTPAEVRQLLNLRVDFRSEDINRLRL